MGPLLSKLAAEYKSALETQSFGKDSEINLPVTSNFLEFRVKKDDLDLDWL